MRVIITGAAGAIGTQAVEELSDGHELCLIDSLPTPDRNSILADLSARPSPARWRRWWKAAGSPQWMERFRDSQVVLHMAVDQRPAFSEGELLFNNLQMTRNVMEAAVRHRVPRMVFASSNWAVISHAIP